MIKRLNGLRVLNTRPKKQGQELAKLINNAGGISLDCPTLEIRATPTHWLQKIPHLNTVEQAIFISANAVEYTFEEMNRKDIAWPTSIKVIAIGQGTARALQNYQIEIDKIPLIPDSEHLLSLMNPTLKNKVILLFKGEGGRAVIENALQEKQAQLIILAVYKRFLPSIPHDYIYSLWHNDAVDIILLTSEQSIHNLFMLFNQDAHDWLQNKPCLVISERLKQAASLKGIKKIIISHPNRIIETLDDHKDYIYGEYQ